jgi:hypothetical protein
VGITGEGGVVGDGTTVLVGGNVGNALVGDGDGMAARGTAVGKTVSGPHAARMSKIGKITVHLFLLGIKDLFPAPFPATEQGAQASRRLTNVAIIRHLHFSVDSF